MPKDIDRLESEKEEFTTRRNKMTRRQRLRRTGLLCLHFLRNLAYYRSWNAGSLERRQDQFWRSINANFIDLAVLEWCKLFGDLRAKHYWSKSVTDKHLVGLETVTGLSAPEFETYRLEVCTYRDKFVAHLDELPVMQIPDLQPALECGALFVPIPFGK